MVVEYKHTMEVVKRNGTRESVRFDKITARLERLIFGLSKIVDPIKLSQAVIAGLFDGIETTKLDKLAAQIAASLSTQHPDFGLLASRIEISNLHKQVPSRFSEAMELAWARTDSHGVHIPMISKETMEIIRRKSETLDSWIVPERDYYFDYFGFKTLEKSYLLRVSDHLIETPQYLWMRVSVGIHGSDLEQVKRTYEMMSQKLAIHATPTLFNAGSIRPQMSSCFLVAMESDSLEGIYNTLHNCAMISKWAGGIGVHVHNIRGKGSLIRGTNGKGNGLVPMLRVFNSSSRYVDQGGGKRNGSIAIYLEPWHTDIFEFLDLKKPHGIEEERARDLFYALWIPDLFMKRVESDLNWSLMCPDECPGLSDCYGNSFEELYEKYESEGRFRRQVPARELWGRILDSQTESGTPYLLYKDAANAKSNQSNLGTIKSSNLCAEIIEYSDSEETAVCNLASINLSSFAVEPTESLYPGEFLVYIRDSCDYCAVAKAVLKSHGLRFRTVYPTQDDIADTRATQGLSKYTYPQIYYIPLGWRHLAGSDEREYIGGYDELVKYLFRVDLSGLVDTAYQLTVNLNRVIDRNYYPTESARVSNLRHRPIGIGVQGLADFYAKMRVPFDSDQAMDYNKMIFEAIYEGAIRASIDLAKKESVYDSFYGSPASRGMFQFDLWGVVPSRKETWDSLRHDMMKYGLRNSLLIALMPTATTSQILGSNECFEPFTSNMYTRSTMAGEFIMMNKYLVRDLISMGLWNDSMRNRLMASNGSIKDFQDLPFVIRNLYRTAWEIPQKALITQAVQRAPYVCQSQSLNLFVGKPDHKKLTNMHFYAWKQGLKTGCYYLRTQPAADAIKFTVDSAVCENCTA